MRAVSPIVQISDWLSTECEALLRRLQDELGFACLFVTHDLAVVGAVAHRIAVLRAGLVVEQGAAVDVLTSPTDEYTRRLLAAAPVADPDEQRRRREQRAMS